MGRMKKVGCWRALAPKGMNEQREEKTKGFWWTARFHFPRRTVELLVWVVLFFGGLWPLPAAGGPPKEENNNTKPTRMSWWKEDWWMNGNEWINLSFHCSGGRLGAQRAGGLLAFIHQQNQSTFIKLNFFNLNEMVDWFVLFDERESKGSPIQLPSINTNQFISLWKKWMLFVDDWLELLNALLLSLWRPAAVASSLHSIKFKNLFSFRSISNYWYNIN